VGGKLKIGKVVRKLVFENPLDIPMAILKQASQ